MASGAGDGVGGRARCPRRVRGGGGDGLIIPGRQELCVRGECIYHSLEGSGYVARLSRVVYFVFFSAVFPSRRRKNYIEKYTYAKRRRSRFSSVSFSSPRTHTHAVFHHFEHCTYREVLLFSYIYFLGFFRDFSRFLSTNHLLIRAQNIFVGNFRSEDFRSF